MFLPLPFLAPVTTPAAIQTEKGSAQPVTIGKADIAYPPAIEKIVKPSTSGAVGIGSAISQAIGKVKSMIDPLTASMIAGGVAKVAGEAGQQTATSGARSDGKSGDIKNDVSFGDFIVNGSKGLSANNLFLYGGAAVVGFVLLKIFRKKAK